MLWESSSRAIGRRKPDGMRAVAAPTTLMSSTGANPLVRAAASFTLGILVLLPACMNVANPAVAPPRAGEMAVGPPWRGTPPAGPAVAHRKPSARLPRLCRRYWHWPGYHAIAHRHSHSHCASRLIRLSLQLAGFCRRRGRSISFQPGRGYCAGAAGVTCGPE